MTLFLGFSPMPCVYSAIYMQNLSCNKACVLEVKDSVDDLFDFTHTSHRMHTCEEWMCLGWMHWSFDGPWCYRIYANALPGVLDGEGSRHCVEAALRDSRQRGRDCPHRLLSQ